MRAAHWTLTVFLTLVGGISVVQLFGKLSTSAADHTHPHRGTLAPLMEPPPARIEAARVPPFSGPISDLAVHGESMAILSAKGWFLVDGSSTKGWFGDQRPGSPSWIEQAVSVELAPEGVFILDERRSTISLWDTEGTRLRESPLPVRATLAQQAKTILMDPEGGILALLLQIDLDGTASWDIISVDSSGVTETLLSLPNQDRTMLFQEPRVVIDGSSLLLMNPLTHKVSTLDLASRVLTPRTGRSDPPLWEVSRKEMREYQKLLGRMGGTMGALSHLPEFWPSVRDLTLREDGSILLAVSAGEDRVHVEHLSPEGAPLGRLNRDGFVEPIFLSHGRVFLVEEETEETVIYEFIF